MIEAVERRAGGRIYVARHGETEWNRVGRWQGATDVPLIDAGRAQAIELAVRLRGVALAGVVSSDLVRAAKTASLVARALGLPVLGRTRRCASGATGCSKDSR